MADPAQTHRQKATESLGSGGDGEQPAPCGAPSPRACHCRPGSRPGALLQPPPVPAPLPLRLLFPKDKGLSESHPAASACQPRCCFPHGDPATILAWQRLLRGRCHPVPPGWSHILPLHRLSSIWPGGASHRCLTLHPIYTGVVSSPFPWQTPRWASRPLGMSTLWCLLALSYAPTTRMFLYSTYPAESEPSFTRVLGLPPPTTTMFLAHSRGTVLNK